MNRLFEPVGIRAVTIKNRIAMAPMNDFHQFFDGNDGVITNACIDYFIERAKGEVGLIISPVFKTTEAVTRYRKDGNLIWNIITRKSQGRYAELAKCVHAYGAKMFFQISAGPGRVARGDLIDEGFVPVSASDNQAFFRPEVRCRALSPEEVQTLVESFGEAAAIAAEAGIDGVEIHGHEGYLIDQFCTALWNRREDKYGGDLRGRLTFSIEILRSVRDRVGNDYPVIYRYGSKHFLKEAWKATTRMDEKEVGRDIDESIQMAQILEEAGYDGLHVDAGCYESAYWAHPPMYLPHGFSVDMTALVKKSVQIPVIAVGKLDVPELAERTLRDGKADLIAIGRGLLADPYWARKVREGRPHDIKPCISCHEGMYRTESIGQFLTCALNPLCGHESTLAVRPAETPKKVLIAGGGIAGMEAARVAHLRGHEVLLYEGSGRLGGQLVPAGAPDFKADIRRLLRYYEGQMSRAEFDVRTNSPVTAEVVRKVRPDVLVVATGAQPALPSIPGVDKSCVVSCLEVYAGTAPKVCTAVVVGGGLEGCEAAVHLARQGTQVTLVEQLPRLSPDVHRANRIMLLDMLEETGVRVLVGTEAMEILSAGVLVKGGSGEGQELSAEAVVLATGMRPDKSLYEAMIGETILCYEIGDCKKPRKIMDAVWEASMIASAI